MCPLADAFGTFSFTFSFDTLYCVLCSLSCPWAVVHYSLLGTLYPLFWCTLRWCPVCCVRHIVPPVFWCVRHIVPLPDWKRAERETGKNIPGIRSTADCTTKYRLLCGDINQQESINWLNGEFMWVVLCPLHVRVTSRGLGNIAFVIERGGGNPFFIDTTKHYTWDDFLLYCQAFKGLFTTFNH